MKAAVCYEYGKPLVVEEVRLDPPQSGEVKVRMKAVAICHSDVHVLAGDWGGWLPVIAGHEGAGIVEEVGEGVSTVKVGDHVVVSLLRSCGRCDACLTGASYLCEGSFALMRETRLHTKEGQRIRQGVMTGAFAEYVVVEQSQLVPMCKEIGFDSAALFACGVITGIGAVVNTAEVKPGSSVAVIGVGGVGLNAIQGARLAGADPIIAIDLLDNKLAAAREFGATHTINAREQDVRAALKEITNGKNADYVFVTVGSPKVAEQAFDLAGRRGSIIFVGIPDFHSTMALPMGKTVGQEKKIMGSFMGSTRLSVDVPKLMQLYQHDRIKIDELITAHYTLEQINDAIANMKEGHALRNVILFDE